MPSPLTQAGAESSSSKYAPLAMDRLFTGEWTQRSPLRDAAVSYMVAKYYSGSRFDSIIGGRNMEMTSRLTMGRRPGSTVYNSALWPRINRWAEFRVFNGSTERIRMMTDTSTAVWDGTGPNTQNNIWIKSPGAGSTYFKAINNTLYFGNGIDQKKWVQSATEWKASTAFTPKTFIVDSNNNLQIAYGGITVKIASVAITSNILTLTLDQTDPNLPTNLMFLVGLELTLSGLTTAAFLNGQTITVSAVQQASPASESNVLTTFFAHADYASAPDTGTATSGNGISGLAEPAWFNTKGSWTYGDGGVQWLCGGPSVQNWGTAAPTIAPTVSQSVLPNVYPAWTPAVFYSTSLTVFPTAGGDLQMLTTAGTTDVAEPAWNPTLGGTTNDGTAVWTNIGGAWGGPTAFAAGAMVEGVAGGLIYIFKCTTAGVSGATTPLWTAAFGSVVQDGTVMWTNAGPAIYWGAVLSYPTIGPSAPMVLDQKILDSGGYLQEVAYPGLSGASVPTWNDIGQGAITFDNTVEWVNDGAYAAGGTAQTLYYYAFKSSVTQETSSLSPASLPFVLGEGRQAFIQGFGSDDPQNDTIVIFATAQGGTTPLKLDEIPMPPGGAVGMWSYTRRQIAGQDVDGDLDLLVQGNMNQSAAPAPAGLIALTYHIGRMWGAVGNTIYYSAGPDVGFGNGTGNSQFSPLSSYVMSSLVVRLWPNSLGMCVQTVSDTWLIQGLGTSSTPLQQPVIFEEGIGLLNYDAFTINGTTPYLMTTAAKVESFDPGAGVTEIGFPVGDQFADKTQWSAASTYVTWHEKNSEDTALYVSDGRTKYKRMAPVTAPESGLAWSNTAYPVGGCSAVQSVETLPGNRELLIGPDDTPLVEVGPVTHIGIALQLDGTYRVELQYTGAAVQVGKSIRLSGLTAIPALNGADYAVTISAAGVLFFTSPLQEVVLLRPETGIVSNRAGSPILKRDDSVNSDNGMPYEAYTTFGSVVLAQSGQVAEVAWFMLESAKVGTQPTIGVRLGEIAGPWDLLYRDCSDPPLLPESDSLWNDRYYFAQNQTTAFCRHLQFQLNYAAEDVPTELLTFAIVGAVHQEKKSQ